MSNKKLIVGIIVIILVIGAIALCGYFISNNNKTKETEDKISQINATEMAKELRDYLGTSTLNINNSTISTFFTYTNDSEENYKYKRIVILDMMSDKTNTDTNNRGIVAFPVCEIQMNSNGNFKSINYPADGVVGNKVKTVIQEFFNNKYNIDIYATYNNKFRKIGNSIEYYENEIYYNDNTFAKKIAEEFGENSILDLKSITNLVFGIDI